MIRTRPFAAGAAALVLLVTLAGCGGDDGGDDEAAESSTTAAVVAGETSPDVTVAPIQAPELSDETRARVDAALAAGGAYLGDRLDEVGTSSLAFLDYVWRRWAVEGIEDARTVAADAGDPDDPSEALLIRLVRPDAEPPERAEGRDGTFWEHDVLAAALHCDQRALPDDYAEVLGREVAGSTYTASHVAYAIQWTRELGCVVPGIDEVAESAVEALAASLDAAPAVADDSLAVAASLGYLGRPDLVPAAFLDAVLTAQHDDGGWGLAADEPNSDWHPSGLAVWVLAAATGEGADVPMIVTG